VTMAALAVIDHFGRRKLMIVGSIGYILSLGTTAWAFYAYGPEFNAAMAAVENLEKISTVSVADPGALAAAESSLAAASDAAKTGSAVVLVSLLVFIASHASARGR